MLNVHARTPSLLSMSYVSSIHVGVDTKLLPPSTGFSACSSTALISTVRGTTRRRSVSSSSPQGCFSPPPTQHSTPDSSHSCAHASSNAQVLPATHSHSPCACLPVRSSVYGSSKTSHSSYRYNARTVGGVQAGCTNTGQRTSRSAIAG